MNSNRDSEEKALLTDHEYDGIQELDYPLPNWWLAIFYLTTIFGIGYFAYYVMGNGPSLQEDYQRSVQALQAQAVQAEKTAWPDEAKLTAALADKQAIQAGAVIFQSRCLPCHGAEGGGVIGPNLTDNFWIHGKGRTAEVAKVIKNGVNDKGMPAWGGMLKDEELYELTAYVKSLHGSHPAQAKPPEGEEVQGAE